MKVLTDIKKRIIIKIKKRKSLHLHFLAVWTKLDTFFFFFLYILSKEEICR